jgi:hypothetical protein
MHGALQAFVCRRYMTSMYWTYALLCLLFLAFTESLFDLI